MLDKRESSSFVHSFAWICEINNELYLKTQSISDFSMISEIFLQSSLF